MEGQGNETVRTESLPATFFADGERSGAATIVKNEGLVMILQIFPDSRNEFVAEIAVFGKILSIFEIYYCNLGLDGGILGLLGEGDEGISALCNIKI